MNHWLCLVCNTLSNDTHKCQKCYAPYYKSFFEEYLRLNHYIDLYITDSITIDDISICDYETQKKLGVYEIQKHIVSRVYWKRQHAWKTWRRNIDKKRCMKFLYTIPQLYPVYSLIESFL